MNFMYTETEFEISFFDLRSEFTERNLLVGSTLKIAASGFSEAWNSIL
jgi:hypothetical protein